MKRIIAIVAGVFIFAGMLAAPRPAVAAGNNPSPVPAACWQWSDYMSGPTTTGDGYTVYQSAGHTIPGGSCDRPYLGHATTCAWWRLVRYLPGPIAYGGWFYSCWTPQPAASCLCGWVQPGYGVYWQELTSAPRATSFYYWD